MILTNVDEYVSFLEKEKMTQAQYLFLLLIYKKRVDLIKRYKKCFPIENDNSMIGKYAIKDLINKGFIKIVINNSKKKEIILTKKFLNIFINKHIATEEIYNIYPISMFNKGIEIPLVSFDRNIFANLYEDAIEGSINEHLEVLKDIEYGKENNKLHIGLEKFVKSQYWKVLRKERINNQTQLITTNPLDNEF